MLATLVALTSLTAPTYYTVVDTGIHLLGPVEPSVGFKLNNRGEIVGYRTPMFPPYRTYGIYWKEGNTVKIESPLGGDLVVSDINDQGVVTGSMDDSPGEAKLDVPFLWTAEDGFTKIPQEGGWFEPYAINNLGVVGGRLCTADKTYVATWSAKDGYKRYDEFDGSYKMVGVSALNDRGDLLYYVAEGGNPINYYVPAGGEPQPLATIIDFRLWQKYAETYATSINNRGFVCGSTQIYSERLDRTAIQGTIWNPDNTRVEVGRAISLTFMNDSNVAVGFRRLSQTPISEPIVWDATNGARDLNSVVPNGTLKLRYVWDINNRGEILATGSGVRILKPAP